MKSHTVPKALLDQFAYNDPITKSRRLWRYQKGRKPYWKASPDTATRIDGHFADPRDEAKELELETRLNQEFEQPVNEYLAQLGYQTFVFNRTHIRQLTGYVTLLFNRSQARRSASRYLVDIMVDSMRKLLADEDKLARVAAKWTLDAIADGYGLVVTPDFVTQRLEEALADYVSEDQPQHSYVGTMENAMSTLDEGILNGDWHVVNSTPDDPFVIGDAPVVTWERDDRNFMIYGQGFTRANVEVFLPVSPMACLHILPRVERTRPVVKPAPMEVNVAQAQFATEFCFANLCSEAINVALQPRFGHSRIGITAFSVRHRDFSNTMFEIIMNRGNWVEPPRH